MDQLGGKRSGASVKTLKKVLKKAGLKTTGKKATLTRRAKKARLVGGGKFTDALEEAAKGVAAAGLDKFKNMKGESTTTTGTSEEGGRRRRKH